MISDSKNNLQLNHHFLITNSRNFFIPEHNHMEHVTFTIVLSGQVIAQENRIGKSYWEQWSLKYA